MKMKKRIAIPLAGLAALVIGVAAVSAASPSPSPSATNKPGQVFLDKLAAILHISTGQLQTDIKQARVETIDQMLKEGKITQAQADEMKKRAEAGHGFGLEGKRGALFDSTVARDLRTAALDAAAKTLKTTPDGLKADLKGGKSLADLEKAAGVTEADLRASVKAAAKGVLDKAVTDKKVTQAQADTILKAIDTAPGRFFLEHGRGHFGKRAAGTTN